MANEEDFGTYKDYPCVVGKHRGHKVQVGEWTLVHVADRPVCRCGGKCRCVTTCHCVLSRLNESTELPAVLAAVAPNMPADQAGHRHP